MAPPPPMHQSKMRYTDCIEHNCDNCRREGIKSGVVYSCEDCDYDLCERCYKDSKVEPANHRGEKVCKSGHVLEGMRVGADPQKAGRINPDQVWPMPQVTTQVMGGKSPRALASPPMSPTGKVRGGGICVEGIVGAATPRAAMAKSQKEAAERAAKKAQEDAEAQAQQLRDRCGELFKFIDTDHSGEIDADELGTYFRLLGRDLVEGEAEEIIASVDLNGNGTIDVDELVEIVKAQQGTFETVRARREIFRFLAGVQKADGAQLSRTCNEPDNSADVVSVQDLVQNIGQVQKVLKLPPVTHRRPGASPRAAPKRASAEERQNISISEFCSVLRRAERFHTQKSCRPPPVESIPWLWLLENTQALWEAAAPAQSSVAAHDEIAKGRGDQLAALRQEFSVVAQDGACQAITEAEGKYKRRGAADPAEWVHSDQEFFIQSGGERRSEYVHWNLMRKPRGGEETDQVVATSSQCTANNIMAAEWVLPKGAGGRREASDDGKGGTPKCRPAQLSLTAEDVTLEVSNPDQLEAALKEATNGTTIVFAAAEFVITAPLKFAKGQHITLKGSLPANACLGSRTKLVAKGSAFGGAPGKGPAAIHMGGARVVISGMDIDNQGCGPAILHDTGVGACDVVDCTITSKQGQGVVVKRPPVDPMLAASGGAKPASAVLLQNCQITGCHGAGVLVKSGRVIIDGGGKEGKCGSEVANCMFGIQVEEKGEVWISRCLIAANTNTGVAFSTQSTGTVSHCDITVPTASTGVLIEGASTPSIFENRIHSASVTDQENDGIVVIKSLGRIEENQIRVGGKGMVVSKYAKPTVVRNQFTQQATQTENNGILVEGGHGVYEYNRLDGYLTAVYVKPEANDEAPGRVRAPQPRFQYNTVCRSAETGGAAIQLENAGGIVEENVFIGWELPPEGVSRGGSKGACSVRKTGDCDSCIIGCNIANATQVQCDAEQALRSLGDHRRYTAEDRKQVSLCRQATNPKALQQAAKANPAVPPGNAKYMTKQIGGPSGSARNAALAKRNHHDLAKGRTAPEPKRMAAAGGIAAAGY